MQATVIVYSLDLHDGIDLYLPSAYLAEDREDGTLGYMVARAVPEHLGSYGHDVVGTGHEQLLRLVGDLAEEALTQKFAGKGRKKLTLAQAYADPARKSIIHQYIQRQMGAFMDAIVRHQLPLCLAVERKTLLQDIKMHWSETPLEPAMSFVKEENGIVYRLQVLRDDVPVVPQQHDVHILLNDPGYVLIDYQLFRLNRVNGNKLKPFLTKEHVFIPAHLTRTYFEKFILDVAEQVDVEASGFDIQVHDQLTGVETVFEVDFIDDRYVLDLKFSYNDVFFLGSNTAQRRNRLHFGKKDEIIIHQYRRTGAEADYGHLLEEKGLQRNAARRYHLPEGEDKYALLHWAVEYRQQLMSEGFSLTPPQIGGKPVCLERANLDIHTQAVNDWFDIHGVIRVGEHTLYFSDLMQAIRKGDPVMELPDGQVFIIPEAWMTQYSALARLGEVKQDHVRIRKSQYTLVETEDVADDSLQSLVVTEEDIDYTPSSLLQATLRPYQTEGVKWLIAHQQNDLGACLADDMGLGKTLQTLAVLCHAKDHLEGQTQGTAAEAQLTLFAQAHQDALQPLQALIVLPASLVFNWEEEIRRFAPSLTLCAYIGARRHDKQIELFDVVLTTYQTALRSMPALEKVAWTYIVLDESHMIKNKESKVFQAINRLPARHKLSLSGTPIENSLADLWSQMQFINPGLLGSYSFFKEHFMDPIRKEQDEAALGELRTLVEPFILRRRKADVARDLPELTHKVEYVNMTRAQAACFETEKSAARNQLLGMDVQDPAYRFQVFRSLMRLRQIANHPVLMDADYTEDSGKFDLVIDHLDIVVRSGQKVLVFSSFTSHLDLFATHLQGAAIPFALLTGQTAQADRQRQVHRFQEDPDCQIFLLSIKAGGTGLNLTGADYVFILDPWWNPFVEEQAIARAHRIGREHPITVIRFISKDSIEEKILRLQASKKVLAAELIEDQQRIDLAREDLQFLLK